MTYRFLVILCENVGDALCTTPAIKLLRDYAPTAQIDALAITQVSAEVVKHNPVFNQVISVDMIHDFPLFASCYTHRFVFIPTPKAIAVAEKMSLPFFKAEPPKPAHLREVGVTLLRRVFPDMHNKESEHYFLYPQTENEVAIKEKLKKAGATFSPEEILIACHVGCSKAAARALKFWKRGVASHRTWPFKNFYFLTESFKKDYPQLKWVLTGTLGEQKIIKKYFKKSDRIIDLTAQTSILELAALMKYCRVFLSGDTGPMHVASTTAVPMLTLFGSTHPSVTGPKPVRDNMIFLLGEEAIETITVQQVKENLLTLIVDQ
ncbi:MAG: glycosyltransferase family 9 protein [Gammaproteobacteria bacterium]|nr:glycosyltransferase family 9 protein [Gammaproteobacteria bacterium]